MISAGMLLKLFEQFDTTCLCCAAVVPEKSMMSHVNNLQKTDENQTLCGYSHPHHKTFVLALLK